MHPQALSLYFTPSHNTKCLLSHSPVKLSISPTLSIVFISQSARVFPCMSLTFPFPPPPPPPRVACSHSLQISASGETLQLLQMLKCWSQPQITTTPGLRDITAGSLCSCFCPLKSLDVTMVQCVRPLQCTTNHCSKSMLMCKAN